MSSRKRRRERAFPDEDFDVAQTPVPDATSMTEQQRADKEQEVWEALREAHFEAIEQLPLTLHRQLALMRQHDKHSLAWPTRLFSTLQKYIKLRKAIAGYHQPSNATDKCISSPLLQESPQSEYGQNDPVHLNCSSVLPSSDKNQNEMLQSLPRSPSSEFNPPKRLKPAETTRDLLSQVAWMSEELLRASQEKVNLAQANHESVERHIQLLDQAIKEQEAAVSDFVISSVPDLSELNEDFINDEPTRGLPKQTDENTKVTTSLTITLPAGSAQQIEELYCYCNRVSFGDMIACDSHLCEREWFHLGCVGLTEIPEGEWYCEDCRVDEIITV